MPEPLAELVLAVGELLPPLGEVEPELLLVEPGPELLVPVPEPVFPLPSRPLDEPLLEEPLVVDEPLVLLEVPLELSPVLTGEPLPKTLPDVPLLVPPDAGADCELVP